MQLSVALQEINKKISPKPLLGDLEAVHEVAPAALVKNLDMLVELGLAQPLAAVVLPQGVFLQLFFGALQKEWSFFVPTKEGALIVKQVRGAVRASN